MRPFVQQPIILAQIAELTSDNNIPLVIAATPCNRHDMVNMPFAQFASAIITLALLPFELFQLIYLSMRSAVLLSQKRSLPILSQQFKSGREVCYT